MSLRYLDESPDVVVLEDDVDTRDMMATFLRAHGYAPRTAVDGIDGLRLASEHRPSFILVDWKMPRMDGVTFITCLRLSESLVDVPVLLMSADPEVATTAEGLHVPYLAKPVDLDALREAVEHEVVPEKTTTH
jgi:DNA-binding response OmpR family regulator